MSSRPLLKQQPVIIAGDLSADVVSLPTYINMISLVSYQAVWTGSGAAGTLQVEVSNNYQPTPNGVDPYPSNSGTWEALTTPAPLTVSGAGNKYFNVSNIAAAWIRLRFVHTGGSSGAMNATIAGKVA